MSDLADRIVAVMSYNIPELERIGADMRARKVHIHVPNLGPYSASNPQYCMNCGCREDVRPGSKHMECPNPA